MSRKFLIAEYCEGPFYMGWWLYLRDRNDGSENDGRWDSWGWMRCYCYGRCRCQIKAAYDLCVSLGHSPPVPERYRQDFAEWFAGQFPNGLLVEANGELSLVEVVAKRPRQVRSSVIRTVARARRSFKRACARNRA